MGRREVLPVGAKFNARLCMKASGYWLFAWHGDCESDRKDTIDQMKKQMQIKKDIKRELSSDTRTWNLKVDIGLRVDPDF
jgi:hypothetical protein